MKCTNVLKARNEGYFIIFNGYKTDYLISTELNMDTKEYQEKMIEYGAYRTKHNEVYFRNRESARKALDEYIIPLHTINQLTAVK